MTTPSQGLKCRVCGNADNPHRNMKGYCDPCGKKKQVEYQAAYRDRLKKLAAPVLCKGCGKPFDTGKTGRKWRCPECTLAYMQEYREKDKKRHAQYSRNYRARLGDAYRVKMTKRRSELIAEMTPEELAEFRKKEGDKTRRLNAILKNEIFMAYGGWVCKCCGETEKSFLSIDHINNDGAKMRREGVHGVSNQFYRWLKKNGYPDGFQVLCMNCQWGKHINKGVCPHQARCND